MKYAADNTDPDGPWASRHPDPGAASLAQTVLSLQGVAQIPVCDFARFCDLERRVTTIINASTLKDRDYEEIGRRFRNRIRRRHRLRRDDRVEFTAGEGGHVLHCFYLRLTRMRRLMSNRTGLSSSLRRSTRGTSETFDPVF